MLKNLNSLKIEGAKNLRLYIFGRTVLLFLFVALSFFFALKLIFPSKYFRYSTAHSNSLKNSIDNFSIQNGVMQFYVSTPQKFSKVNLLLEFEKANNFSGKAIVRKAYKAFFYPIGKPIKDISEIKPSFLISQGESVYLISDNKKYPINNPETFVALGYSWDNIQKDKDFDLSKYEKQKLLTINSPHPSGTVFVTNQKHYFYIENGTKRPIQLPEKEIKKVVSNPIFVSEKSLTVFDDCQFKKNLLSNKKYYCLIKFNHISDLAGNQYQFKVESITDKNKPKFIVARFDKSINKDNLKYFLIDLSKKLLARFNIGAS